MRDRKIVLRTVLGLVLILSLFLVSCGSGEEQLTGSAIGVKEAKTEEIKKPPVPAPAPAEYDPLIAELREKSKGITNYQYFFQGKKRDSRGNYQNEQAYTAYIKEDKVKKAYPNPVEFSDGAYYNEIYLIGGKALGICSSPSTVCEENRGMAYELDYALEKLKVTPKELIQKIPLEAKEGGEEVLGSRKAAILNYKEGGKEVKLSVDKYYGLPLKKTVFGYEDDVQIVLEEYLFMELVVGGVKNKEVSLE